MSTSGFLSLGAPPLVATGEPLEPAASSFELPGEYDVTGAFNFLVNEKNLSRKDATFEVARDVSRRAGIPESAFRAAIEEGGFTPEQIISRFTGARDPGMIAAAAEGVAREYPRAALSLAGLSAGVRKGLKVPGPLPVKAAAVGALGIGGFLTGLLAGEAAGEVLVTPLAGEGQILPSSQPAFEAGRTFGGVLGGIRTTLAAARALPEAVNLGSAKILTNLADYSGRKGAARMALGKGLAGGERVLSELGKRARTPVGAASIAAGEAAAGVSMGVAGGVSEQVFPGEALPRVAAEMTVGVFQPTRVIAGSLPTLSDAAKRFTKSGREDLAADYLNRFFDTVAAARVGPRPDDMSVSDYNDKVATEAADALDKIIFELRQGNLVDAEGKPLKLTPGQVLNSPELLAMERQLFRSELGSAAKSNAQKASQDGLTKLAVVMKKLSESGDPRAIYASAKLERDTINELIRSNLDAKAANAVRTISRITDRLGQQARDGEVRIDAEQSEKLGGILLKAVEQSMREWRQIESQAYGRVNMDEVVQPGAILEKFRDLTTQQGYPGRSLPKEITDVIAEIGGKDALDPLSKKTKDALDLAESDLRFSRIRVSETDAKLSAEEKAVVEGLVQRDREATAGLPEMSPARQQRIQEAASARIALSRDEKLLAGVRERAQRESNIPLSSRPLTLRQIQSFRSDMLDLARDGNRTAKERRIFGQMAEAALDDLGVSSKRVEEMLEQGIEPSANQRQLLRAYAISREGNDVFTRTFAGKLMAQDRTGAERIPPEVAYDELLKGTSNRTTMKINDVREALRYLPGGTATPESAAAAAERVNDFENTIDRFLAGRLVDPYDGVLKTITPRDPTTGKDLPDIQVIDPGKLRRFRRDFQDVLNMDAMKALSGDLADAEKASTLAISAIDEASQRYKNLKDNRAFGRIIAQQEPLKVVAEALGAKVGGRFDPEKSFKSIIRTVNRTAAREPEMLQAARDGLRNNVLDWAFQEALKNDGTLDLKKYNDALFKPVTQGQSSPMQMLIEGNIVTPEFNQKLRANLANVQKLQDAVDQGENIDEILASSNPTLSFLARFAGARVGAAMGTGTIQVPGYFAREAQALFDTAPSMALRDILVSASEPRAGGYDEMEKLLGLAQRRRADGKQATNLLAKFLGSVFGTGAVATPALRAAAEASIPISQEERPMPIQPAPRPTAQAPMAPPPAPRPVAQAAAPRPMPAPMPAPAPAAPQADTRARYAALYPFESTSQMIRATSPASGGIGSLMG